MLAIIEIACLACAVAGLLVVLDRALARAAAERAAHRAELAELLQRIQAPHAAVAAHHAHAAPPAGAAASPLPLSDHEIAAMEGSPAGEEERDRLIAWMEAVENGSAQLEDGVIR